MIRGHIQEYRPGRFRVIWHYKGERFDTTQYLDQTPLYHRKQAERLLEHVNSLIDSHKFDPSAWRKDQPYLFEKAIELWTELSRCSPEWLYARKRIAEKILIPFFKGEDIRDIRKIHIDRFVVDLKARSYSDKYVYNLVGELRAFFRFHRESIPKVPAFPTISYQDAPIRWLDETEQAQVFEFIPEQDLPVFTFMRFTGCRPNEAGGLLRENVFQKHKPPYLILATVLGARGSVKENTKTKRVKPLPLIPELQEIMKPQEVTRFVFSKGGRPYSKKMLERIWNKASRKAHAEYGTPAINLYNGLKHSFGCQRLNQGFSLDEVRAVMGHADIRTTGKYAKYATEKLSPVMRGNVKNLTQTLHRAENAPSNSLK